MDEFDDFDKRLLIDGLKFTIPRILFNQNLNNIKADIYAYNKQYEIFSSEEEELQFVFSILELTKIYIESFLNEKRLPKESESDDNLPSSAV